ncbi:MAG: DUF1643 domain-containing protein [Candidatus Galacturonibacter soehngenii]|nr:DUF1643 domain-containing protein [Candidatus Galacturonibacter soehngenii]
MSTSKWIYKTDNDNLYRYSLGYCKKNPLICIGVNPSTARPEKLDPTIQSVSRIAQNNGYDGWIMLNLYPQRSTDPNGLDLNCNNDIHSTNIQMISNLLDNYDISDIWAAWGTLITKRDYLKQCLDDLYSITKDYNWVTFGKKSKNGHPHHPLYLNTNASKESFNLSNYISLL